MQREASCRSPGVDLVNGEASCGAVGDPGRRCTRDLPFVRNACPGRRGPALVALRTGPSKKGPSRAVNYLESIGPRSRARREIHAVRPPHSHPPIHGSDSSPARPRAARCSTSPRPHSARGRPGRRTYRSVTPTRVTISPNEAARPLTQCTRSRYWIERGSRTPDRRRYHRSPGRKIILPPFQR